MTTAARPTWDTARGGSGKGERDLASLSKQYSSRDLPGQTSLKHRDRGQGTESELKEKDFKRELEEREWEARAAKTRERGLGPGGSRVGIEAESRRALEGASGSKKARTEAAPAPAAAANLDADDPLEDDDESGASSDDDSDDDTAALMAELQKIKAEKAVEEREREDERREDEEKIRMENILAGNPLLKERYSGSAEKTDMRVKRRWDDDVVFKNCSRAAPEKKEANFINDSLRSEFHRKFMNKYIK